MPAERPIIYAKTRGACYAVLCALAHLNQTQIVINLMMFIVATGAPLSRVFADNDYVINIAIMSHQLTIQHRYPTSEDLLGFPFRPQRTETTPALRAFTFIISDENLTAPILLLPQCDRIICNAVEFYYRL